MKCFFIIPQFNSSSWSFSWSDFEVKDSEIDGAGQGLFAKCNIPQHTLLPVLGKWLSEAPTEENKQDQSTCVHIPRHKEILVRILYVAWC